jgi:hypothetical protein
LGIEDSESGEGAAAVMREDGVGATVTERIATVTKLLGKVGAWWDWAM